VVTSAVFACLEPHMTDLVFVLLTLAIFGLLALAVKGAERL
jgi:hypothetical protein